MYYRKRTHVSATYHLSVVWEIKAVISIFVWSMSNDPQRAEIRTLKSFWDIGIYNVEARSPFTPSLIESYCTNGNTEHSEANVVEILTTFFPKKMYLKMSAKWQIFFKV